MLNKLDDYPIHQTPEPIAHPATSDRNVYDRTWFNGYSNDGQRYFGIGMAIYPHRGVLDCAFSVVEQGGRQHAFYGSRRAPLERTEMRCSGWRAPIPVLAAPHMCRAGGRGTTTPKSISSASTESTTLIRRRQRCSPTSSLATRPCGSNAPASAVTVNVGSSTPSQDWRAQGARTKE